jgi:hypothetical protein
MKGILPESIRQRRTKGDYTSEINRAVLQDVQVFQGHATGLLGTKLSYLPPEEELRKSLEPLKQGLSEDNNRALWSLSDVMALEEWLKNFFDGKIQTPNTLEI